MARIHIREFPLGLYSRLGPRFMTALYRQWIGAEGSIAAVGLAKDDVVAFAVGKHATCRCRSVDLARSTIVAAGALAVRPMLWRRAAMHYARLLKRKLMPRVRSEDSELTFISVEPQFRQRGIGTRLLSAFEASSRMGGCGRCTLVTEETNIVAREFYGHRGWRVREFTRSADGRSLVRLVTGHLDQ